VRQLALDGVGAAGRGGVDEAVGDQSADDDGRERDVQDDPAAALRTLRRTDRSLLDVPTLRLCRELTTGRG
jgi:hypothetical protein